jgi:hypothetical protein
MPGTSDAATGLEKVTTEPSEERQDYLDALTDIDATLESWDLHLPSADRRGLQRRASWRATKKRGPGRIIALAAAIALGASATPSVVFGQKIYWVGEDAIQRANLNGTDIETILSATAPDPIALDLVHDHVYWWDVDGYRLQRASLNGTAARTILEGQVVDSIAIDPLGGKLYWVEWIVSGSIITSRIWCADLDGSKMALLIESCCISGLDLDPAGGWMYWSDWRDVWRARLDGSEPEIVLNAPQAIVHLAVDSVGGFIYWTDPIAVRRAELAGGSPMTLFSGVGTPHDIDVDAASGRIYWSMNGNGILSAGLDGSDIAGVGSAWTRGIALDLRECSGHGQRLDGRCACDAQWQGDNCGCFTGGCPSDCSSQGECLCGVCECDSGWSGQDCSCSTVCPGNCSGHGTCNCGICACDPEYVGDDCSCFTGACPNDCSGHGACECGQCLCDPGWEGPDCSCEPQDCPGDCSGHGSCICGLCDCNPGWIEADCSVQTQSPVRVFLAPDGLQHAAAPMGPTTYLTPAGTTVRLMAWMEDVTPAGGHLNAYQLILPWRAQPSTKATGCVEYVDNQEGINHGDSLVVDRARPDWVFADTIPLQAAFNETPESIYGVFYHTVPGTYVNPAELGGIRYLFEFDLQVSADAAGVFELVFRLAPESGPLSALMTTFGGEYVVDEFQRLRIVVGPTQPLSSEPPHQAIDPRHADGASAGGGATFDMIYNGDAASVTTADFSVEVSGGRAPQIADIEVDGNVVALAFDQPFPAGECTTIRHLPGDWHATIRALPGDVNGDGLTSPVDIFALVDHLNGVLDPPLKTWQCDLNLSGECEPSDILALIDLLNGAGGDKPWNGAEAPQCP